MDEDESAWEHIISPLARVLNNSVGDTEVKKSDLESLSDVVVKESIPMENMKRQNAVREMVAIGSYNGGNAGARAAFYDPRNRAKPSLPKLKFLEGKE